MMTTFDPTADPSGNPATSDEADTEPASTEGDSGSGETGLDDMASTTSPGTTEPAESGETGTPVDEQPESIPVAGALAEHAAGVAVVAGAVDEEPDAARERVTVTRVRAAAEAAALREARLVLRALR